MSRIFTGSVWRCETFLFALAAVLTMVGMFFPGDLDAATKRERQIAADRLVKEALSNESYGQDGERKKLLDQALQQAPDHESARWHTGHVKFKNRWVKIDQIPTLLQQGFAPGGV